MPLDWLVFTFIHTPSLITVPSVEVNDADLDVPNAGVCTQVRAAINASGRGDLARRPYLHPYAYATGPRTRASTLASVEPLAATSTSTAAALTPPPCVCREHSSKACRTFFSTYITLLSMPLSNSGNGP